MNIGFLGPAVATVLTVYGIETTSFLVLFGYFGVATVLTVYGIETQSMYYTIEKRYNVATVLIVYGIETFR